MPVRFPIDDGKIPERLLLQSNNCVILLLVQVTPDHVHTFGFVNHPQV